MSRRYLAITGGVGGAKLALGLAHLLPRDQVVFAVNTGDDFEHLGLHISPDIDTLTYTLSAQSNTELGWGRKDETWNFLDALTAFGGESWFRLGDKDLALHVTRTQMLQKGATLSQATAHITASLGIKHEVLPMSDDPVRTFVNTATGALAFQHYFVRDRCEPSVTGFQFRGVEDAQPNPGIMRCLQDVDAVIICPSNPFVSVDPLLSLPGMRAALASVPVVAVSPIVAGIAIKGPTAKMMAELNIPSTATAVAEHYGGLLDGFVLDASDSALTDSLSVPAIAVPSVMQTLQDKIDLAEHTLAFTNTLFG